MLRITSNILLSFTFNKAPMAPVLLLTAFLLPPAITRGPQGKGIPLCSKAHKPPNDVSAKFTLRRTPVYLVNKLKSARAISFVENCYQFFFTFNLFSLWKPKESLSGRSVKSPPASFFEGLLRYDSRSLHWPPSQGSGRVTQPKLWPQPLWKGLPASGFYRCFASTRNCFFPLFTN